MNLEWLALDACDVLCKIEELPFTIFLGIEKISDGRVGLSGSITSNVSILSLSCFRNYHAQGAAWYGSKKIGRSPMELIQCNFSLLWLDLNVRPTDVEILTDLKNIWSDIPIIHWTTVSRYASVCLYAILFGKLAMAVHLILPSFLLIAIYVVYYICRYFCSVKVHKSSCFCWLCNIVFVYSAKVSLCWFIDLGITCYVRIVTSRTPVQCSGKSANGGPFIICFASDTAFADMLAM